MMGGMTDPTPTARTAADPVSPLVKWQRIASDPSAPAHLRATARRAVRHLTNPEATR